MYEVLLAVDDSEPRAVTQARAVSDLPGTDEVHVTLLHSFTDNPSGASASQVASVRRAREILDEAGVETNIYEESGDPTAAILDTAAEIDADVICVGGRERSPAGKALFGSVAQDVILRADRPVLVTGGASE
jgi:nucleotide-binding universal stress UspA family protein